MKSLFGIGHRWRLVAITAFAAAAAVFGVPYLYTTLAAGDTPPPLAADPASVSGGVSGAGADSGIWRVTSGSQAGYRIKELLMGQDTEAVGRTSAVRGEGRVDGARLTSGSFSVDLTTVRSNHDRRDEHFHDRIMDTDTYPTATFTLTEPVDISAAGAAGASATVPAKGNLTLRGTTRPVTVRLAVQRGDGNVHVHGSFPVKLADWNIPEPEFGPVMSIDKGQIEFLLVLTRT
jgi:polyisoprenoid-binding protein YceI